MAIQSICVYCGSRPGNNPAYVEAATRLGGDIAKAGIGLVYGGGANGMMGEVAKAVLENGGHATGIIPEFLISKEQGDNPLELSELIVTKNMHERKAMMFEKSDAFVALPGGVGTLEEIVEIMTWAQLARHKAPIVFANIEGFWQPMLELIGHMDAQGFVHTKDNLKLLVVDEAERIVEEITSAASA